jgi:hypothetical protein
MLVVAASLTIPNARYVQILLPLLFINSAIALDDITARLPATKKFLALGAMVGFIVFPRIGELTLDRRSAPMALNFQQPPAYRQIAREMAQTIKPGQLVITNLDAWAAWYEGLTTMWFPLKPEDLDGHQDAVPYIVITSYQENDADFALGSWKEVVYQPDRITDPFLKKYYRVEKIFTIPADQAYENSRIRGTILVRI